MKTKIDLRDIKMIWNLYYGQKAVIKREDMTEKLEIRRGVLQGSILSPILFNLNSEDKEDKTLNEQGWSWN